MHNHLAAEGEPYRSSTHPFTQIQFSNPKSESPILDIECLLTVVPRPIAPTNNNRQLRHVRTRDGPDHLCTILCDTSLLSLRAHHVTSHVHQEEEGNLPLRAEFDEVGGFQGRLGEQDTVVRYDADGVPMDVSEALAYSC